MTGALAAAEDPAADDIAFAVRFLDRLGALTTLHPANPATAAFGHRAAQAARRRRCSPRPILTVVAARADPGASPAA